MSVKLLLSAIFKFILGVLIVGVLIFLPAGTLRFFNGWLLMALLFVPMFVAGIVMYFKNPKLLEMRLNVKEKQREQDAVVKFSGLMFMMGFVIAGLDFRYEWSSLPKALVCIASVIFLVSYLLYAEVLRENKYLSRTIEVSANQKVVDKGLYGIVRHPMYMATLLLFLSMPLILDSLFSFFIFILYPLIIVKRLKYEEKLLEANLEGYTEYKEKVKFKLIPFIW